MARATRPVASITFDDFPKSAWRMGGSLLAEYGLRGTYYTTGGLAGRNIDGLDHHDADDLAALSKAGHEIGCHGFGHDPTPAISTTALKTDAVRNAKFLKTVLNGEVPVSYAFPFGEVSPRAKLFYSRRFVTARGVHPGIHDGMLDLPKLCTLGTETSTWDEGAIAREIAHAKTKRGWIVFMPMTLATAQVPMAARQPC